MPLKILLIRHAQALGNAEGRMLGCSDAPLVEAGRQQVQSLVERLRLEGRSPTHLYSSPLNRAQMTARLLRHYWFDAQAKPTELVAPETSAPMDSADQEAPLPLLTDTRLTELDNGIFQGLTWTEAKARHLELCQRLESQLDWFPVPGAETPSQARDRAEGFVRHLLDHHHSPEEIWIITHAGILGHLWSALLGCDRTWGLPIKPLGCFEVWLETQPGGLGQTSVMLPTPSTVRENHYNTELQKIIQFNA